MPDSNPASEAADAVAIPAGAESDSAAPPTESEVEAYIESAVEAIQSRDLDEIRDWATELLQSTAFWIDVGLLLASIFTARLLFHLFRKGRLPRVKSFYDKIPVRSTLKLFRVGLLITTWLAVLVAELAGFAAPLLRTYSLILTCFVFISLPSQFISWKSWMSFVSTSLFVLVALHILGLLDNTIALLDGLALDMGGLHLTALNLIQGLLVFLLLFWLAGFLSAKVSDHLSRAGDLPSNVSVLISKSARIGLFVLAILITMNVMGLKITTLAVFGGALGLGLGFGLQKVVSNLVSGIILLLDKSIKPGDVIEIGETYGWINSLNLRYVSVVTRDNKEHLIPNEDLITHPVVNWSFSNQLIRVRAPFGISYSSDLRLAMDLATQCAKDSERVVASPEPRCNLMGFGDSGVDLELRFWIDDPHNGVGRVQSEVLLKVWDAFHENGITFPFPQRDVHLRFPDGVALSDMLTPSDERKDQD